MFTSTEASSERRGRITRTPSNKEALSCWAANKIAMPVVRIQNKDFMGLWTKSEYGTLLVHKTKSFEQCDVSFLSFCNLTLSLATGGDLQGASGLVAYWKFDDPGTDGFEKYGILVDSSGHGNDLDVLIPPVQYEAVIVKDEKKLLTGGLKFKNNYAMNPGFNGMPQKDITIEFWARSGQITGSGLGSENYAEFFSFSAIMKGDGNIDNDNGYADSSLIDDAIRIERYLKEYNNTTYLKNAKTNTLGSISIHINSNREGNGKHNDNWLDFAANWYVLV